MFLCSALIKHRSRESLCQLKCTGVALGGIMMSSLKGSVPTTGSFAEPRLTSGALVFQGASPKIRARGPDKGLRSRCLNL